MTLGFYRRNNLVIILTKIQNWVILLSSMVFISCTNLRLMYSSFPFAKFDKIKTLMDEMESKPTNLNFNMTNDFFTRIDKG